MLRLHHCITQDQKIKKAHCHFLSVETARIEPRSVAWSRIKFTNQDATRENRTPIYCLGSSRPTTKRWSQIFDGILKKYIPVGHYFFGRSTHSATFSRQPLLS